MGWDRYPLSDATAWGYVPLFEFYAMLELRVWVGGSGGSSEC